MIRNKWAIRIAQTIAELECINDDGYGLRTALEHLDKMLLEALAPMEKKVYLWIVDMQCPIISQDVTRVFRVKPNHASMILKALTDYCLLDRREVLNVDGKYFVYTMRKL